MGQTGGDHGKGVVAEHGGAHVEPGIEERQVLTGEELWARGRLSRRGPGHQQGDGDSENAKPVSRPEQHDEGEWRLPPPGIV
jgi:hypothetical protein